ncbi:unnamed protein product [Dracunculus medinensis]|uniref:ADF-H domain-containing protein n=1 Tax=Dracunculus medinensis TaxID=318479 RepID=A0A0N4UDX2_DRAME|nr:unnamed protein product [Dracunculus medinensis]
MSAAQKIVLKNPQKLQEFYSNIHEKKIYSYVIFEISEDGTIVVDDEDYKSYADFFEKFVEISRGKKDCVYAMVDVEARRGTKKLVFILYCDEQTARRSSIEHFPLFSEMKKIFPSADLQLAAMQYRDIKEDKIKSRLNF